MVRQRCDGLQVGRSRRARGAPLVEKDEFVQRPAPHGSVLALGATRGDCGGHEHRFGDAQQRSKLGVDEQVPHGHHAPVTERPGGEQQVLASRVDRGTLSGVVLAVADQAGQDQYRDLVEVLDVGLHRLSHDGLGRRVVRRPNLGRSRRRFVWSPMPGVHLRR